ncbi:hypothetical protein HNR73_002289 [Phytomonospora endophytica]|uniref:Uncharacterized protein n=1 Tax=Phytomonospora endophytica TaxID=714109 RepID=A0A841FPD4_9ACTN|nr:hypothetical protein [Phytomonospora endophytica]
MDVGVTNTPARTRPPGLGSAEAIGVVGDGHGDREVAVIR